ERLRDLAGDAEHPEHRRVAPRARVDLARDADERRGAEIVRALSGRDLVRVVEVPRADRDVRRDDDERVGRGGRLLRRVFGGNLRRGEDEKRAKDHLRAPWLQIERTRELPRNEAMPVWRSEPKVKNRSFMSAFRRSYELPGRMKALPPPTT